MAIEVTARDTESGQGSPGRAGAAVVTASPADMPGAARPEPAPPAAVEQPRAPRYQPALVIDVQQPPADAYDGQRPPRALKVFATRPGDRTVRLGIQENGRRGEIVLGPRDVALLADALDQRLDLIDPAATP